MGESAGSIPTPISNPRTFRSLFRSKLLYYFNGPVYLLDSNLIAKKMNQLSVPFTFSAFDHIAPFSPSNLTQTFNEPVKLNDTLEIKAEPSSLSSTTDPSPSSSSPSTTEPSPSSSSPSTSLPSSPSPFEFGSPQSETNGGAKRTMEISPALAKTISTDPEFHRFVAFWSPQLKLLKKLKYLVTANRCAGLELSRVNEKNNSCN